MITGISVRNTEVHVQASLAPVLSSTSTPKPTPCGLRVSTPSFPSQAVTQTTYAGQCFEHGLSYSAQGELSISQIISLARYDSVITRPFIGPSPIMSAVTTSVYQFVHP